VADGGSHGDDDGDDGGDWELIWETEHFDVVMSPLTNLLLESLKGYGNINLVCLIWKNI
jgi:hypothetical protein